MTGFWDSELGTITGDAADAFAKTFTQIPDGTMALARIEAFVNAEYQGNKYLSIDWLLTDGDFRGQKVNQKLKVYGDPRAEDPAKARHRALNMLKLIYQLYNTKPKHAGEPTDADLAIFIGKAAGIRIRETEPDKSTGRQYNWVAEIHEAKGFKCETGTSLVVTHNNTQFNNSAVESAFSRNASLPNAESLDDGIPF
jgi:hypothetical protein